MRHRSLTNSRKHANHALAEAYRRDFNCDEIAYLFPEDGRMARIPGKPAATYISRLNEPASELHHITRRILGTLRWDVMTNLISLCEWTHRFCHGEYAHDGLVLCLKAKLDKHELDWNELDRITHLPFRGWVETRELKCDWVRKIRDDLLAERRAA